MCSGCCRYIPDNYIAKIPFIGKFVVQKNNAEVGGIIYYIFRFFLKRSIQNCERGWEEEIDS